ncbi:hypothetical protein V2J09_017650 [Rumex salicifolius]
MLEDRQLKEASLDWCFSHPSLSNSTSSQLSHFSYKFIKSNLPPWGLRFVLARDMASKTHQAKTSLGECTKELRKVLKKYLTALGVSKEEALLFFRTTKVTNLENQMHIQALGFILVGPSAKVFLLSDFLYIFCSFDCS